MKSRIRRSPVVDRIPESTFDRSAGGPAPPAEAPGRVRRPSRRPPANSAGATPILSPEVNAVLAQFRVIFRSVRRHDRYIEEQSGIGAMQLRALAMVDARPGIGVTELAAALLVHQPTASKLVENLVALGLLKRQRSTQDARFVELLATPAGRDLLLRAPAPVLGILPDGLQSLEPRDLGWLRDSLAQLMVKMKRRDDAARFEPLSESQ